MLQRSSLLFLIGVFIFYTNLSAETIRLKSGRILEGEVSEMDEKTFKVVSGSDVFILPKRYLAPEKEPEPSLPTPKIEIYYGEAQNDSGSPSSMDTARLQDQQIPVKTARSNKKVKIYVTSWCPYCQKLEDFLKKEGIRYSRNDIEKSRLAKKEYEKLGGGGVPLICIDSQVIRGFDKQKILVLINK
jgi:glutaredoxin